MNCVDVFSPRGKVARVWCMRERLRERERVLLLAFI
jgi:hypothetical protein